MSQTQYVYMRIADAIAAEIKSGKIGPGAMLTGERALREEHGVALNTVRRAVKELRDRGLVETLPAKGTFVLVPEESDGSGSE